MALGSPGRGGARIPTDLKGAAVRPSAAYRPALCVVEPGVEMIEKQQVLAFDVEYQAFGVHGRGAENTRVEQRIQQERGVAGLGGDTGDAADVDMGAFGAVDEIEIKVDRIFVTAEPGRQTAFDFIEIECGVSLFAYSTPSLSSR